LHAVNNAYLLARAVQLQALIWYRQHRPEEARSEALSAIDMFEKLGAAKDVEYTRMLLRWIDEEMDGLVTPGESDDDGELFETVLLVVFVDSSCSDPRGYQIHMIASMSFGTPLPLTSSTKSSISGSATRDFSSTSAKTGQDLT